MDAIGFQEWIDIGFVAFVVFACAKSLFADSSGLAKRPEQWRAELSSLETTLRELISEASVASRTLDRNLLRRQEALSDLLERITALTENNHELFERVGSMPLNPAAPVKTASTDFPNNSWTTSQNEKPSAPAPAKQEARSAEASLEHNRQVRNNLRDSIEVSSEKDKDTSKEDISEEQASSWDEFKPSLLDPTVYKIAKRLLRAGKEIHVVARKLELPLAEVRLLDKIVSDEDAKNDIVADENSSEQQEPSLRPENMKFTHLVQDKTEEGSSAEIESTSNFSYDDIMSKDITV